MYKNSYKKVLRKINHQHKWQRKAFKIELEIIKNKNQIYKKIISWDDFEINISTIWDYVVLSVMWFLSNYIKIKVWYF